MKCKRHKSQLTTDDTHFELACGLGARAGWTEVNESLTAQALMLSH